MVAAVAGAWSWHDGLHHARHAIELGNDRVHVRVLGPCRS